MFIYKGSKLEADINLLKKEASKSEYEKIANPLKEKITRLENENYKMRRLLERIVRNMNGYKVKIAVCERPPSAMFYHEGMTDVSTEKFYIHEISLKEELYKDIIRNFEKE